MSPGEKVGAREAVSLLWAQLLCWRGRRQPATEAGMLTSRLDLPVMGPGGTGLDQSHGPTGLKGGWETGVLEGEWDWPVSQTCHTFVLKRWRLQILTGALG